jgi:hypothetical protein
VFIVGAPRCGTSSLWSYLAAHPRLFMSKDKEPHHFGRDLGFRWRPYEDRGRYLELFEGAGDRQAGEASVLYLYSQQAPAEILAMSPSARIVIMLRDPFEMIPSLHAHNLLLVYEDLLGLDDGLAAEADRREGRRIPKTCIAPLALEYTRLARYAEPVQRYREAFGPERVKVILFDDFKKDTARVFQETLAFLGLEPMTLPEFKTGNAAQHWRSQRVAQVVVPTLTHASQVAVELPRGLARNGLLLGALALCYLPMRLNVRTGPVARPSAGARETMRRALVEDVGALGEVLGRDLSGWLGGSS